MITHLPIFGTILGAMVLLYGIWSRSSATLKAAYLIFVVSAIGAGIAYSSGEAAEEAVENLAGVAQEGIEEHEEFAINALIASIILAVLSLVGIFVAVRKSGVSGMVAYLVLATSLITFGLAAWTGYLGGQIRHTEITSVDVQYYQDQNSRDAEEDD
jgi:uncharacterized membrane protein